MTSAWDRCLWLDSLIGELNALHTLHPAGGRVVKISYRSRWVQGMERIRSRGSQERRTNRLVEEGGCKKYLPSWQYLQSHVRPTQKSIFISKRLQENRTEESGRRDSSILLSHRHLCTTLYNFKASRMKRCPWSCSKRVICTWKDSFVAVAANPWAPFLILKASFEVLWRNFRSERWRQIGDYLNFLLVKLWSLPPEWISGQKRRVSFVITSFTNFWS